MLPYKRSERVAKSIQRLISDFLQKEVNTEGLVMVTVTGSKMSDDLKHVSIYYSAYGSEEEKNRVSDFLVEITPSARKYVGRHAKLRYTPEIIFRYDGTIEYAAKIDELINRIHEEDKDEKKE